jgi:hypothetical protein
MDLFETFAVYRPHLQAYHFYFKDDIYELDFYDEATQNDIINNIIKVHKVSENNLLFIFSDDRRKNCTIKDYSQFIYDESRDPAPVPESFISLSPPPPEHVPEPVVYDEQEEEFDFELPPSEQNSILTPLYSPLYSPHSPSLALLLLSLEPRSQDLFSPPPFNSINDEWIVYEPNKNLNQVKNIYLPPVSKRVEAIVIKDALEKGETCPITLSPLTNENACCVSPCYHVFDKESITKWISQNNNCPLCKEKCIM